ncbi:thioesterase family protein [Kocuria sp.]|uniref:thioesterase family protein n=1 Tax=Kocuria sp. TaxID=1871328 RepID=UPI0026DADBB3|nr:thioesterase family protein [Kocuria sp.]MDO4918153.1 thioesterase family protein [Kocuria sp.]
MSDEQQPLGHLGANGEDIPQAHYVRTGEHSFRTTLYTQGAWSPLEQHMAASSGLLVHEIERNHPREDVLPARFSFDILGFIAGGEIEVHTRVLRPGRTIELLEATMSSGGRDCIRLSLWRLKTSDTREVAGGEIQPLTPLEQCEPLDMYEVWGGGYIRSLEARVARTPRPGSGAGWLRITKEVVAGEPSSPTARFISAVDAANGLAPRAEIGPWAFPNVDLGIHMFRAPVSEWVGLDTSVDLGGDGVGLTHSELFDEQGPLGRVAQALTVRRTS